VTSITTETKTFKVAPTKLTAAVTPTALENDVMTHKKVQQILRIVTQRTETQHSPSTAYTTNAVANNARHHLLTTLYRRLTDQGHSA